MIEALSLTKRYGSTVAVSDLSFTIRPGMVTGFLGPNGSGKTTTMRMILGLDYPTTGTVTIGGVPYARLAYPMREVGALLDARAMHGGRTARSHLLSLAQTNDIPRRRVDQVLSTVGLTDVGSKRSKGFSLGMSQRLGIAAALLGDPQILMFDEPVNGLDPEGIVWIRTFMRSLAAEGRTVLVSSHLMSEMEHTADHLLVIGRGRLIADCSMDEFVARSSGPAVLVRTPQRDVLASAVTAAGGTVTNSGDELSVRGLSEDQVAELAFANGVRVHHLAATKVSLEQAFMELTAESVDYHAELPGQPGARSAWNGGMTMTAVTTQEARPGASAVRRRRAGLSGTLRSELTKIISVRSTYWSLALMVLASVAWSIAFCAGTAAHWPHMSAQSRAGFDPTQSSVIGLVLLGQLVIAVLGALTITAEYSTQAMRTSLTVMPRRGVPVWS